MPKAEQSLNELLHEIRRVEKSREVLTEKKIRSIYKQLLKELNHFLADEYLKYSQNGILTVAMLQEKSHYAKFLEEIEANVNTLTPEITSTIRKTVEDTYTACYKGMTEAVLNAKDIKSALDFLKDLDVRPEVMKRAIENPISGLTLPDILEKNRKEVIYDIKQQVNIGFMNGDRYDTTAKKVAERLDISYGKATNIVRTETHRVTEGGFMDCAKDISESLEDSEFVYAAIWRNMNDERVRPQHRYRTKSGWRTSISKNGANHQKMEGKIIQVGDKFQLEPDVYAECPGNSGTARNDCRCRCFLEYDLMTKEEFAEKGGKLLDKSEGNGIIEVRSEEMYRKSHEGKIEPMPKKQLRKIEKAFKARGGIIQYDDTTDEYLKSKNAEAITYNETTILIRKNAGRASVFEELIHTAQYRCGENDGSYLSRLKCEISAQQKLLKYANAYKLTEPEVIQTKKALQAYKKELDEYIKNGGV